MIYVHFCQLLPFTKNISVCSKFEANLNWENWCFTVYFILHFLYKCSLTHPVYKTSCHNNDIKESCKTWFYPMFVSRKTWQSAARCFARSSARDVDIQRSPTGGAFPGPSSGGQSAIALPRSHSPIANPQRFATFRARHRPLCPSIVRRWRWGPSIGWEQCRDWLAITPPLRAPAGDPTPITYSGKIESLDRDPGMRFPRN